MNIPNLPLLKLDIGSVTLGAIAIVILMTGWPFGNPMSLEDIWTWGWKGIFWITLLGTIVTSLKIISDKYIN